VGAEIGVGWGRNSEFFLQNLPIKTLYCIDPWEPYDGPNKGSIFATKEKANEHYREAMKRLKPFKDKAVILEMTSKEASEQVEDNSLDFIFIDGDHSYDAVINDLNLWWPKVKVSGVFSGHDWSYFDVARAVKNWFNDDTKVELSDNDIWYCIKWDK
jgi:hypothetical protein